MQLDGIEFGPAFDQSGVRGFFGEGYWWHHLVPGLDLSGSTFVAKTTTLAPRQGNMALDVEARPARLFPDCVKVNLRRSVVLNAVGLSGPGARKLFASGRWQSRKTPFMLSFMAVGTSPEDRDAEYRGFAAELRIWKSEIGARFALQVNFSCPNAGKAGQFSDAQRDASAFLTEAGRAMDTLKTEGIPLIPKLSVTTDPWVAAELSNHPACAGIAVTNTVPWGALPRDIDWHRLWGSTSSPLAKYGGGGMSGRPLLPLVCAWIPRARDAGLMKPLIAGGGILHPNDVPRVFDAGASAIAVGCAAILRPWRVAAIVRRAHKCAPNFNMVENVRTTQAALPPTTREN